MSIAPPPVNEEKEEKNMCTHRGGAAALGTGAGPAVTALAAQASAAPTLEGLIDDINLDDVVSSRSLPGLTGSSEAEISQGEKARNLFHRALYRYAAGRDSSGRQIDPGVFQGLLTGTVSDRAAFIRNQAVQLSFGDPSLVSGKEASTVNTQRDMAERMRRLRRLLLSKKTARWWSANGNSAAIHGVAQKYIDGNLDDATAKTVFGL